MLLSSRFILLFALFLSSALLFGACGGETEVRDAEEVAAEEETYEVRGFFIETNQADQTITIVHEEIPDVMSAMRMRMILEDTEGAEELSRGDIISFTLARIGNSWYVRDIELLPEDTELELEDRLRDMAN